MALDNLQDINENNEMQFQAIKMVNAVNEFSTDETLAGDSDSAVPTEKAVKTYVDNNAGGTSPLIQAFDSHAGITSYASMALNRSYYYWVPCNKGTYSYDTIQVPVVYALVGAVIRVAVYNQAGTQLASADTTIASTQDFAQTISFPVTAFDVVNTTGNDGVWLAYWVNGTVIVPRSSTSPNYSKVAFFVNALPDGTLPTGSATVTSERNCIRLIKG